MKITQLFDSLTRKFVPMPEGDLLELTTESTKSYRESLESAKEILAYNKLVLDKNKAMKDQEGYVPERLQTMPVKERIVLWLDQWYVRYVMALLYIYLVPKIKNFMLGITDNNEDDDNEDEDFEDYKEMKRRKRGL